MCLSIKIQTNVVEKKVKSNENLKMPKSMQLYLQLIVNTPKVGSTLWW